MDFEIKPDDSRWFTPQDIAEVLEISEVSVRGWARDKAVFPHAYLAGRKDQWRIPLPDVYEVILSEFNVERYKQRFFDLVSRRWQGDTRISPPRRRSHE